MKAAIIGYGKMGHEIETILRRRGHDVALIIDADNQGDLTEEKMHGVDVAIEFTTPATAFANVAKCLNWGVPVVSGTTGWNESLAEARRICEKLGGTFFYASNYSIGMNIFFRVNEFLASLMNRFPEYGVSIREIHHVQKKDAPSGTAITLAQQIIERMERKSSWEESTPNSLETHSTHRPYDPGILHIESIREGTVAGIHSVAYDSEVDTIKMEHAAKSRAGLAFGAVLAAEFTQGRKGVLSMVDLMNIDTK